MFKKVKNFVLLIILLFFMGCPAGVATIDSKYGGFESDYIYFVTTIKAVNNQNAKYSIKKYDDFQERTNQILTPLSDNRDYHSFFDEITPLLGFYFADFFYDWPFPVTGETMVHNIIYWFKINRVWDAASQQYHFSLDEGNSLLPSKLVFEVDNQSANQQLQLRIPAIVINGTNETLSKNFIYREDHNLTFSMLTNHFKVNQDHCYFPEVNIFLPANDLKEVSLSITNDIDKNGYYCYPNETKNLEIRF